MASASVERQATESTMRFAAATAGLKCSRFGGSTAAPGRAEVEALLTLA
jgi:sulfofructose kinase